MVAWFTHFRPLEGQNAMVGKKTAGLMMTRKEREKERASLDPYEPLMPCLRAHPKWLH